MKNKKNSGFDEGLEHIGKVSSIDMDDGLDVSDDALPDTLGAVSETKPKKKKAGLKKRLLITLIVLAAVAVVLTVVYFAIIKPIYDDIKEKENALATPEPMIEGEVRDSDGITILLYKYTDKAHTKRITVECADPVLGVNFTLMRNKDGEFYLKEHGEFAPIEETTTLNVISAAGHTVINRRLEENCTDLSVYGLDEASYPRKVTIEDTDGVINSYYIGDRIPSQGGYYCRAEGRNAVYILKSEGLSAVLGTALNLINPILGPVFDENSALMMEQFVLTKNGQRFVSISFDELDTENVKQSSYKMNFPASYIVDDNNYSSVLSTLATLEGYMVVAAGDGTAEGMLYKNTALMAQFGFYDVDNPPFEVYYEYGDIAGYIMFTQSGSDAYYYAYSLVYDTIVLVEKSSVSFLEWDLLEYVSDRIFYEYIKNVSSLSVSGKIDYSQTEYTVDEKFIFEFDSSDVLHTKALSTGVTFSGNVEAQNYIQAFYMSALMVEIGGYISEKEAGFDMSSATEYARFTVEYIDGESRTYIFYKFSGYCYFTINGAGEFYVSTAAVNRLLVNALRAANNCPVDVNAEYPAVPDNFLPKVE